ncbi:MAG TPA: hypothetical protein VF109_04175 [Mycobacteriales bacterium]
MRRWLAALPLVLLLGAVSCDAAGEVQGGIDQARSSAASATAGLRQACTASRTSLATLGDLAQQLADNPDLRTRLAPRVRTAVDELVGQVGSRPELRGVVAAARDLTSAIGTANRAQVELAAKQAVVAVKGAQGVCDLAT